MTGAVATAATGPEPALLLAQGQTVTAPGGRWGNKTLAYPIDVQDMQAKDPINLDAKTPDPCAFYQCLC